MPDEKIRLVIVDDHPTVRFGLESLLRGYADFDVVALAESGAQALTICNQYQPDVILMDLAMPEMDGIETTRRMRVICPKSRLLILTSSENDEHVAEALEAGATGYLLKNAGIQETINAIRAVYAGKRSLSPEALEGLIRVKTSPPPLEEPLSEREREILLLLTQGQSNAQIAQELSLAVSTVKFHLGTLYKKLNVLSRAEAVSKAFGLNLVRR
jgi:two-component system, NarL family, response regulator LiaR